MEDKEDMNSDIIALGRIAAAWAEPVEGREGKRARPLPAVLQAVLQRLTSEAAEARYPSAAVLLEELERAGADVPANAAAWERLLRHVREEAMETPLKMSA
jgi:hypothetical protein